MQVTDLTVRFKDHIGKWGNRGLLALSLSWRPWVWDEEKESDVERESSGCHLHIYSLFWSILSLFFLCFSFVPLCSFILWTDKTKCILTQSSWKCQRSNRRIPLLPAHQFSVEKRKDGWGKERVVYTCIRVFILCTPPVKHLKAVRLFNVSH